MMQLTERAKVGFEREEIGLCLERQVSQTQERHWNEPSREYPRSGKIRPRQQREAVFTGRVSYLGRSWPLGFLACSCHCVSIWAYPTNRTLTTHNLGSHSPGTVWLMSISTKPAKSQSLFPSHVILPVIGSSARNDGLFNVMVVSGRIW
jgi:hypothetical protein